MKPLLEWFAIFALAVFSFCCVIAVVYRILDELCARRQANAEAARKEKISRFNSHTQKLSPSSPDQYNGLRNGMARAALDIAALWEGEAIPSKQVCEILALLVNRRIFSLETMREAQGESNNH